MISVKYSLTKDDYINYYTYVRWDAPEQRKAKLKYYGRQVLINGGLIGILLYTDLFRFNPIYLYAYGAIIVISAVAQIIYARSNVKKQAERFTEDEDNRSFFLETQLEISEAGFSSKDELQETTTRWPAFIKKQETPDYYFLFTSSVQAMIIPKRLFKTMEEKQQFEKLLSKHLSFDAEVGHLLKD